MALSYSGLISQFLTLSQNNTSLNQSLAGLLINQQHKYLLLKYFDNERSFTMTTIGPQTLSLTTASLAAGSTSGTLTAIWPYISCSQLVVFSDSEQRTVFFTQNSATISWQSATKTVQTSASLSCVGVQGYPLPANISKLKNATITIGQLVYTPAPVQSIQEWTKLNALPYTAAYPAQFFVFNDTLNFWPIPSTTGYVINLYAQINVPDMTYADYSVGSIANAGMVVGSNLVLGSGTNWTSFPQNTDLTFSNLFITSPSPSGDGLLYQIQNFTGATGATILKPIVNAPSQTGTGSYIIGQYPLLDVNFHDAIVYGALRTYFSSISKDTDKASYFGGLFNEKLELMKFYLSTKQVNVDLGVEIDRKNPNIYTFAQ